MRSDHNPLTSDPSAERLGYREAAVSPCADCPTAPCCTCLPLGRIRMESLVEVDHARFLLNFERIELGLSRSGHWDVLYLATCQFLDPEGMTCRLHDQPGQPRICRHYDPYRCWYRSALTGAAHNSFLRVDRHRLEAMLPHLTFDGHRRVVDVPDWSTLQELCQRIPTPAWPTAGPPIPNDPPDLAGGMGVDADRAATDQAFARAFAAGRDPCGSCPAGCCRYLIFPWERPRTAGQLDYLRFALGFPGVSIEVSEQNWRLMVRTTCRHLTEARCDVFGQPGRPLECRYLDAWQCTQRPRGSHSNAIPDRLDRDNLTAMMTNATYDADGRILSLPWVGEQRDGSSAKPAATIPDLSR